jgi:hypothetical protein
VLGLCPWSGKTKAVAAVPKAAPKRRTS